MWHQLRLVFLSILNSPRKVFYLCLVFVSLTLIIDGTFWNLWELKQEKQRLVRDIHSTLEKSGALSFQIHRAKDPNYLKKQARDRLDLLAEDEIVFLFPKGE